MKRKAVLLFIASKLIIFSYAQSENGKDSLFSVIQNYHDGFKQNNIQLIRNAIGNQLIMFDLNKSTEDWSPHMFLNEEDIDGWISWMIENAGPFTNDVEPLNTKVQNGAAIVTTRETGRNKFRQWEKQNVKYLFGKIQNQWKIIGFSLIKEND